MAKIPSKDYQTASANCIGCGQPGEFSILLAGSPEHWYLPNQYARSLESPPLQEVWFCKVCMKILEDGFRETLAGLGH